jgi:hypothetical protein
MERTHAVHPEPAWRERADFIIDAKLPKGRRLQWEQLWARQVGPYRFEVCCIPFFVYDLALGDEVETGEHGDERYVLQQVSRTSGHYTFRVWFGSDHPPSATEEVLNEVERLGCLFEWYSDNLLALDAPTDTLAQALADLLYAREQRGELEYETGRTR